MLLKLRRKKTTEFCFDSESRRKFHVCYLTNTI